MSLLALHFLHDTLRGWLRLALSHLLIIYTGCEGIMCSWFTLMPISPYDMLLSRLTLNALVKYDTVQ